MPISGPNQAKLTLLTVSELAEILKMNAQVIARKLNSGEIEGFKLGKDWRVSEEQLLSYLEAHANTGSADDADDRKVLRAFLHGGKLKDIPATRKKRLVVLKHLVSKLAYDRVYPEKELNQFLAQFHSDVCTLRREMIINKLMVRKDGNYKVVAWRD